MIIAGIMTGTSVDGIDVAVVRFGTNQNDWEILFTNIYEFSNSLETNLKVFVYEKGRQTKLKFLKL
jgi:1,6-anhydro-N-acetylmuramate kinase